jgi:hypothetical protein
MHNDQCAGFKFRFALSQRGYDYRLQMRRHHILRADLNYARRVCLRRRQDCPEIEIVRENDVAVGQRPIA